MSNRGGRGRGRGRGGGWNNNNRRDASSDNFSNNNIRPRSDNSSNSERARIFRNPQDVERENVQILSGNFESSELTYKGSDKVVFIPHEDEIQSMWKRLLKKELNNQHHIRRFLNSCLVVASGNSDYELSDLIAKLSEPDGRQRLREIMMFPVSVDAGLMPQVASFQRVTLPFLALLTRSGITDSILESNVNAIYTLVYTNLEDFINNKVIYMLEILVQRNSVDDQRTPQNELLRDDPHSFFPTSLGQFFLVIVRLCSILLDRMRDAAVNDAMNDIIQRLEDAKLSWQNSFSTQQGNSNDPLYSNINRRDYFFFILDKEFKKVKQVIKKHSKRTFLNEQNSIDESSLGTYREKSRLADLKRSYDPPGELSHRGPRHNNDFSDISKISIIPTQEEILSDRAPFLPTNIPGAPHFLPEGITRLLDSQFRLLREDMLHPLRMGINSFLQFLADPNRNNKILRKYQEKGGKYRQDNGDLYIYPRARFVRISVDKRRGFSCRIAFSAPTNSGKNVKERTLYWKKHSKKLMNGNLVCLLLPTEETISQKYSLFFGVVVQRDDEQLAKFEDRVEIDISFMDAAIYPLALKDISNQKNKNAVQNLSLRFMVECTGIYLESCYHVLKTLQSTNDSMLPFEKYLTLASVDDENQIESVKDTSAKSAFTVDIPDYARAPEFRFNLKVLLRDKQKELLLNVANANEHENVVKELVNGSSLDDTQAKALVSSLSKEIALIEGPPGTGKTVVGIEIMKVLLAEENRSVNLTPILVICFTNHALDQFLEHLIDKAGIDNIVRLGGRSKSDKIAPFSLEEVVKNREKPVGVESYLLSKTYQELENIQKDADQIQERLNLRWLDWKEVSSYLYVDFHEHYNKFFGYQDPEIPSFLLEDYFDEECDLTGKDSKNQTLFDKWLHGVDIKNARAMLKATEDSKQLRKGKKNNNTNTNVYDALANYDDELNEYYKPEDSDSFFEDEEYYDDYEQNDPQAYLANWQEPKTNRPLEELKNNTNIWRMSTTERVALHDFWRHELNLENVESLANLQRIHDEKRKEIEDIHSERRKKILKECDVIGMTTNGAAKFQSLVRSVRPKIILCEEAGEVLEAHILSALTPSTQHLILIGDHNQLRPHIATHYLSCDSSIGKKYGLDESLFERLVKGDKATRIEKSQLLTQRRMRAIEISDLIRHTLYKELKDGENTTKYPKIRGAQHNVYFINHRNHEDKCENELTTKSHSNKYEVDMIIEIVKFFVRNGYTKQDDIAVLTPYLGQMVKLRDALKTTFTVVIDERDSQDLAEMEDENEDRKEEKTENNPVENISIATKKSLNQQVTLRTVDNFQGEEANIVIISLVRNSSKEDDRGGIGFLKSTNRSNVLLSRAKHGMYLLGNAELMANKSQMWADVIGMLRSRNQVGDSFPILCPQHPNNRNNVKVPQQFAEFAPDGGCLESCGKKLEKCGHLCPYKCHFDNPDHIDIICRKSCTRLHPECKHPCNKSCGDKCGDCTLIIGDITLPSCGHKYPNAKCYESRNVNSVLCRVKVFKTLPKCGHKLEVMCNKSVDEIICKQPCGELNTCDHPCSSPCNECQKRSIKANEDEPIFDENGYIKRNKHGYCRKKCERNLFCGHKCEEVCHEGKNCMPCTAKCTVSCSHSTCKLECFKPCSSCAEQCDWYCPHGKGRCLLSCGAPCSRLPCDLRCEKRLECGHQCPGVCGEICPTPKFCVICAPDDVKEQMIDILEFKTFAETDLEKERVIILDCGHVFTMETMDHHMEMEKYYQGDYGNWTDLVLLSSKSGENKIMTCPTCRAPIKSKRYGRSIKKRILDTQNKKFLTKYDLLLKYQRDALEKIINKIENNRPKLLEKFRNRTYPKSNNKKIDDKNTMDTNKTLSEVSESEKFYQIEKYHFIPEQHANLWRTHVRDLLNSYQKLMMIMSDSKNPPYKKAFEAAVTRLYNEKSKAQFDSLFNNLENLNVIEDTESPENQKKRFEQSLRDVGLIAPQFDRRLYLDAFFEIVNVQKILFDEATRIVSELPKMELAHTGNLVLETQRNWIKFCSSINDSINNHLVVIIQTCKESLYKRHLVVASMEYVEFEYQFGRFIFNNLPRNIVTPTNKEELKNRCNKIRKDCEKILNDVLPKVELEYFQSQCTERISKLLKNVDEFHDTVERSGQLSQQEKLEISRAMSSEFIGSGHWYECPNGHPYTIGECGGAMQMSRCPDCGVFIGGNSHLLTSGNRRNDEFETMTGGNIIE
ncbi:P-loop containing nucleoside triphosphate hydrolase protein [Rhizophagus irregularis]|uniref:P-loop containing nucleoside triphosphate hydrolase protein n=1 Tax=Rhizophagus irregularis TaxID=588596 RepID=A0A2I1DRB2_9GLOM|nr:P-loop containing nucleoside triphosphate hydrolase protein [Rhizophagus irregularis]PKY12411.1 P-loop containing nucleoside triphosphate hydrolase protein [Rhizophagus irregularis]